MFELKKKIKKILYFYALKYYNIERRGKYIKKHEILDRLLESNNGYLYTREVVGAGISKTYLAMYVKEKGLERVAQGVYLSAEEIKDELYVLQLKNEQAIFSHETALYLHGMMEREPSKVTMTVKNGYNATHLRKQGVKIFQTRENRLLLGVSKVKTNFGNVVTVYNKERTICDIVSNKKNMDIQIFQTALKEYVKGKGKNLSELMEYSFLLGVEEEMRLYMEVLL